MKLFSVDIRLAATAYVQAETEEEAIAKVQALSNTGLELSSRRWEASDEVTITGETHSRDMPELTLSPAMTIPELRTTRLFAEEVEDFGDEDENEEDGE